MATPYAVIGDLRTFGAPDRAFKDVPVDIQEDAIAAASGTVDSYLRAQFVMPIKSWGREVTRIVCQIATYDLLITRGYNPEAGADGQIEKRADQALAWLNLVAAGKAFPDVVDSGGGIEGQASTRARVVSDASRGYSLRNNAVGGFGGGPGGFRGGSGNR